MQPIPPLGPLTRWRRNLCRHLAVTVPGGQWLFPTRRRLLRLEHRCLEPRSDGVLVFLPGIADLPGDFARHGFLTASWESGLRFDAVEADSHVGYYLRRSVARRIHEDLVQPAREAGYQQVWLVGVSLGGLGALLHAREHPDAVTGVVLLAPFVGFQKFIDAMIAAGGPHRWRPHGRADFQHDLWHWLVSDQRKPPICLGFGEQDEFAPANRLLGELLPQHNVFVTGGGHDWLTWGRLWAMILASRQLSGVPRSWERSDPGKFS